MRIFLITLLGMFSFLSLSAQSNTITISGVVNDVQGQPVIGASVIVKGSTTGSMTDFDGRYSVNAPADGVLEIKYLGYISQEIVIQNRKTINVVLKEDTELLDEVVVIGYGSVKKNDATGAITALKAEEINKGLTTSAQDLLVGKAPGVSVTPGTGQPGSAATIRIRGGSSLNASNDPLIVIDGVIMSNKTVDGLSNGLSTLNPADIETFTILKDASSTAIYGSRASNGVIIITTKKGSKGKVKFSYNGNMSITTKRNSVDVLSGDEYRELITNMPDVTPAMLTALNLYPNQSTNWQDEVFRTAVSTDHHFSAMGTVNEILPYRISAGYTDENGILKTSNFQRFTGGVILTPSLFDDHLKVTVNAKGSYIKNRFANNDAVGAAVFFDPTKPVYNDSAYGGYYAWTQDGSADGALMGSSPRNPLSLLNMRTDKSTIKTFVGSTQFDYKLHFFPDLRVNVNLSYDYSTSDGNTRVEPNSAQGWNTDVDKSGSYNKYSNLFINKLFESYAQYVKEVPSIASKFDAMGGYSYQSYSRRSSTESYYLSRDPDKFGQIVGESALPENYKPSKYVLLSYYGRFNYTLLDRYLLTFTLRNDASSRFAKGNRSEWFPSVALGWKINDESFMRDIKSISNLKLRLGWGKTGQQDTGDNWYPSLQSWQWGKGGASYPTYDANGNVTWVNVIKPIQGNENLKWETTATWNFGLDYGFLNNRISGAIDVYFRKTSDLINNSVDLAAGTGFADVTFANIGDLENKGIEFSINATPVQTKDFAWDLGFNIGYNKSKITKLTFDDAMATSAGYRYESTGGDGGKAIKIHSPGYAPGSFYVFEQIYDANGKPIESAYVDRNDDGVIDNQDLYQYKKPDADVLMGFSSKFTFKAWDFGFNGRVSLGNYNYNAVASNNGGLDVSSVFANTSLSNRPSSALETNFETRQRQSDYYIQNASFLKIDNITLGYTFSPSKSKIKARVYGTVQNPIVITKYDGLDPEVYGGMDNNFYPRPLTFVMGVNLNF